MTREIHKQVQFVQINKNEIQSNMHKIRQYNKILLGGFFVVYLVLVSTNQAHAAVALRSFSEVNSLTASEPSGTVQGDFLVAYAKGTGNNVELTPPAGWTAIVTPFSVAYSTPRYVGAWYIVRGSSAPSYTWTGPTNAYIVVTAWTGVDTGNPIQNVFSSTTATSATPNGPLVITEVANSMLVTVALQNNAAPTLSSNPTGMTNIQTNTTSRIHSARQIIASTGGTGVRQWTFSSSTLNGLISFAIAPPPANPTISTPTSASITSSGATLGGNITAQGGSAVTARGVCYAVTATNANPQSGGSGVTCVAEGNTGTGVFTKAVTGLTQNTGYSYTAYATNTQGTAYTSASTFSTLNVNPTGVDTNSPTGVNSYYVTLSGVANPNSYTTTGHFRVYSTNPGNCNSDSGGIRYPQLSSNDISVGADTSPHTFTYTIPPNASTFLEPSTQYWYCSYAINTNGTTGGASAASFTTGDGPSSPCDPPTTGNLTIPATATCNLSGNFNGVDTGSGTTNTGALILSTTAQMTIGPSQQVAFGSFQLQKPNSSLVIARGGSLKKGGVFVHDKDGDGILDDKTQYVGSTPSAASEFVRRNTLSTNYNYAWKMASVSASTDCNPNSAYVFRNIGALVGDADNDGYKTSSSAAPQCVGTQSVINGRTYFKDTSNVSSWLPDGQKLSANTDCDDASGAPCVPTINSFTSVGQTSQILNFAASANGPAPTSYDVYDCGTDPACSSPSITNTGSTSYTDSSLTCNNVYYYRVLAKNGVGSGPISTTSSNSTASCGGTPTVTTSTPTSKATTSVMLNSTINPNNSTTSITYRYGTSNVTCASLPSTIAGPTGLTGSSPLSGATTQQSLTGLTAGTRYYFCATANNSFGTTNGAVASFWTVTSAPTIASATSQTPINSNIITRSGSVTGASSYNLYYCTGVGCTPASTLVGSVGSPYTHSGLTCGTVYRYQLTAVNADGDESAKSSIVGATTTASGTATTCYPDIDNDNYTLTTKSICTSGGVCGNTTGYQSTVGSGSDCYDANSNVFPGQTSFFSSERGVSDDLDGHIPSSYDYNCDDIISKNSSDAMCSSTCSGSYYVQSGGCNYQGLCDSTTYDNAVLPNCGDTGYTSCVVVGTRYSNNACSLPFTLYQSTGTGQTLSCR